MPPRGPTAYFLFAGEVRTAVQEELAAGSDGKVGVAAVGKAIGQRWNALSDEQKRVYKERAAQMSKDLRGAMHACACAQPPCQQVLNLPSALRPSLAEQDAALSAEGGDVEAVPGEDGAHEAAGGNAPRPPPFGLPTSLVKKICHMDPDVDRISADGARALAKATSLFVEMLACKACDHARQLKRKNFKFADIEAVAQRDRRTGDMGLPQLLAEDAAFAEVHDKERAGEENQEGKAGKRPASEVAQEEAAKNTRPLTSFFNVAAPS